jgi:fibronectin type 3 domain-containing protein
MRPKSKTHILPILTIAIVLITGCGGSEENSSNLPDVPTSMSLSATVELGSAYYVKLSWSSSGSAVWYYVIRDGTEIASIWAAGSSLSYTDRPRPRENHCYQIYASTSFLGYYAKTQRACVSMPKDDLPSTPSNLTAISTDSTHMNLSWNHSTDDIQVIYYNLYRDGVLIKASSKNSFVDSGLNPETNYCYSVAAIDGADQSSTQSNQVCETTQVDVLPPSVPEMLRSYFKPSVNDFISIGLSWSESTDNHTVSAYNVYRNGNLISTVNTNSIIDTTLNFGDSYYYTVSAVDPSNNESFQSEKYWVDASWKISRTDLMGVPCSLAIDSTNKLHTIYYGRYGDEHALLYATNKSGGWETVFISYITPVTYGTMSLDVDTDGYAHISFYENDSLKYANNTSGLWEVHIIDMNGAIGKYNSIAVDSKGNTHISYLGELGGQVYRLMYATDKSGAWETQWTSWYGDGFNSIAVDVEGNIHLSTYNQGSLFYFNNMSGAWKVSKVDGGNGYKVGNNYSMAMDSQGNAHIVYNGAGLKYATNKSGNWEILALPWGGSYPDISIDSWDNVHISIGGISYISNASGLWEEMNIDVASDDDPDWVPNNSISVSRIAIDSDDGVHIIYHAYSNLRYAKNNPL